MTFEECYNTYHALLMEGAIGERLKREYKITFNQDVSIDQIYQSKNIGRLLWDGSYAYRGDC